MNTQRSGKEYLKAGIILAAMAAFGAVVFLLLRCFPPETHAYPSCPLHRFAGVYCPGCGSTRMLSRLFHGRIFEAMRQNPLAFVFLPFVMYCLLAETGRLVSIRLPMFFLRGWMIYTLLAIIMIYWLVRNIPLDYLAPLRPL